MLLTWFLIIKSIQINNYVFDSKWQALQAFYHYFVSMKLEGLFVLSVQFSFHFSIFFFFSTIPVISQLSYIV